MTLSLRTKVLGIVSLVFAVAFGMYAAVAGTILLTSYRAYVHSNLTVAGEHLSGDLQNILAKGLMLHDVQGFEDECRNAISSLPWMAYAVIVDLQGSTALCAEATGGGMVHALPPLSQDSATTRTVDIGGKAYIEHLFPFADHNGNVAGFVRLGVDSAASDGDVWSALVNALLFALLILAIGLVVGLALIRRILVTPLAELLSGIRAVENEPDRLDRRLRVPGGDEISEIAEAFNDTLKRLQETTVSRAYFDGIVENVANPLVMTGYDGTIVFANPAMSKATDAPPEELPGTQLTKWFRCATWRTQENANGTPDECVVQAIQNGRVRNVEGELSRADGSRMDVILSGSMMLTHGDGGEAMVILTAVDVTELRRAERERRNADEALRASEQRYKSIVEDSPTLLCRYTPDGVLTFVNTEYCKYFGKPREELIGHSFQPLIPEEDRAVVESMSNMLTPSHPSITYEHRVIDGAGEIRWQQWTDRALYDASGRAIEYQSVGLDITDQKLVGQKVLREKRRAETYLDIAGVIILALDGEGRITLINKKGCAVLGWAREEAIGQNWFDLAIPENRRDELRDVFKTFIRENTDGKEFYENSVVTKSGETRLISWHNTAIYDDAGNVVGTLSSGEDVTEMRKTEQNFQQALRMEALGNLAGSIAHDFNNMLLPIISLTEMTLDQIPKNDHIHLRLEKVVEAAQRARDLVAKILAYSHQADPVRANINLFELIQHAMDLVHATIPTTVELVENLDAAVGHVFGDAAQLETSLLNLITNAVDALDAHTGRIEVSLTKIQVGKSLARALPDLEADGDYAKLSVADTGMGMSSVTLARVFDPFFTTKEVGHGTGLGLPSVMNIVSKHGGALNISSDEGAGTTVDIYLPLSVEPKVSS